MKTLLFVLTITLATVASAKIYADRIPVLRQSKNYFDAGLRVTTWLGEYPGPVIDVTRKVTVRSYQDILNLKGRKKCTIQKGIYHPWSTDAGSTIGFLSIVGWNSYLIEKAFTSTEAFAVDQSANAPQKFHFKPYSKVLGVYHLAEGWCRGSYMSGKDGRRTDIEFYCPVITDNKRYSKPFEKKWNEFHEQWIMVRCEEGYTSHIQDITLLKKWGVKQGTYGSKYGTVQKK